MPICQITQVTNPTSSSSVVRGSTLNVRWNHNSTTHCTNPYWSINAIKLQTSYPVGNWSDVSTLYSGGFVGVIQGSTGINVTIPSSINIFGDYYRLEIEYLEVEF